jgi:DNA-binding transcriptional LysR family regulator
MQMKQLEEQIGLPLLEQVGKRMFLTEAGQELRGHARDIASRMVGLNAAMDQFRGLERGLLRLAVVSTANYFLPRLIADFNRLHPGVRVSLQVANREFVLSALVDNSTDLAITGQPPDSLDVVAQNFMDNPLVVIAAPGHPLASLPSIPLQRMVQETLVVRESGSGTRAAMERLFATQRLAYRAGCEFGTNEALKQAVRAGLGLGGGVAADHRARAAGRLPGGAAGGGLSRRPPVVRAAPHAQAAVRRREHLPRHAARARPEGCAGADPRGSQAARMTWRG